MMSGCGGFGSGGSAPPALTPSQFVIDFPEFANSTTFPPTSISFWIMAGSLLLNRQRFGSSYTLALELFVAHNVAIEALNVVGASGGGIPGLARGVVSSESGVDLSVSYDTGIASVADAGQWNLTNYGTRLKWLINMFGAGPIQVGPGFCGLGGFFNGLPLNCGFSCGPGWYVTGNTFLFEGNL
jgi:hypothetical protein